MASAINRKKEPSTISAFQASFVLVHDWLFSCDRLFSRDLTQGQVAEEGKDRDLLVVG